MARAPSINSESLLRLPACHKQVLAEFLAAGVKFLVIGGRAVVFHGHNRATNDLDLWLCPTTENVDRLAEAVRPLGYTLIPAVRERLAKPGAQLPLPHWETDLLTSLAGLEFETCFAQANISDIGDGTVRVLSRSDIIVTKATSDRQLDQDDVVALNAGIDHG